MTVFKNIKDNKIWGYSDNWLTHGICESISVGRARPCR